MHAVSDLLKNFPQETADNIIFYSKCVLCTVCVIAVLYLFRKIFRTKRIIVSREQGRTIAIANSALKEIVTNIAKNSGIQGEIRTSASSNRREVVVTIKIRCGNWQNVSAISRTIQEKIDEILRDNVGVDLETKLNVIITGFLLKKNANDEIDHNLCEEETCHCKSPTDYGQENCQAIPLTVDNSSEVGQIREIDKKYICSDDGDSKNTAQ